MIIKDNFDLTNNNTMHLKARTKKLYIPENEKELKSLVEKLEKNNSIYYILSGGSNLLLNDQVIYENVIYMSKVNLEMKHIKDNIFYIGASNKISKVINFINENGYGGFEELFCLPALFGGIIYMNAGIGSGNNIKFNISDFILRVKILNKKENKIMWISKDECAFSQRKSLFQNDKNIIIGAEIKCINQSPEISKKRILNRINVCKEKQEYGKGCFGTLFSIANPKILKLSKMLKPYYGGVKFSYNNANWLVNTGNARFQDIRKLIWFCKILHILTFQKIELEVRKWD